MENGASQSKWPEKFMPVCFYLNLTFWIAVALLFFVAPSFNIIGVLRDSNIRTGGIPQYTWTMHRNLTPKFERWAKKRLESSRATTLTTEDISGTEWPLFGAVFYLWATESLQEAWENQPGQGSTAPNVYAAEAIQAATQLVIDPKHANWVKLHWGETYLTNQNIFYRMLIISALTSHSRLTGDQQYLPQLREQVETLASELDTSRHGLLEDYPGECYPGDVLMAIAMIHKADGVLGTDHRALVSRAIRGFRVKALDERGLVPYAADAKRGVPWGPSRGCANSYVLLSSPLIWPAQARQWYELYARYFWQETWTAAGFREFPCDLLGYDWYMDVDAGPVLKGYGFAACAFGLGAARLNGHFEHAYPLTAELFAVSCPLPGHILLFPRWLSNATDAPYLGEAAILYILTRLPTPDAAVTTGGSIPLFVLLILCLYFGIGALILGLVWRAHRAWQRDQSGRIFPRAQWQLFIWLALFAIAGACLLFGKPAFAAVAVLAAQIIPKWRIQSS